ncbi:MAG: restriction endonuclease subunit S, partial [Anaerolineae bacterium]|nr:restriction endonuclease subunit S [Anaerolineae bacterium]
ANLKRYKAAVLKAAVEGKLTEEWRKQNPDVEPASKLLRRILLEGKIVGSDFDPVPSSFGTRLPASWSYVSLDLLIEYTTSGSRGWAKYYSEYGDKFIRAQNLSQDVLDLSNVAYVSLPKKIEGKRTRVRQGDILITITGANVTKAARVEQELEGDSYISQHVSLVRPLSAETSKYLYLFVVSPGHGRRQLELAAYGAGKPGLNLTNIRELGIALPPLTEQKEIVQEWQRMESIVLELLSVTDRQLKRAESLKTSILASAFSGEN